MEMAHFADWAEWLALFHDDGLRRGWRQEFAAVLDHLLAFPVGKESEMPDLYETAGEHMQEEPSDELDGLQCHLFDLIVVP
jgi:hypothetical protein